MERAHRDTELNRGKEVMPWYIVGPDRTYARGVVVFAGLAAFGGGTIRDVLLNRRSFFRTQHAAWL